MSWTRLELVDAILAYLVREWWRLVRSDGQRLGKTKLQKLVYFCKASGVPMPYTFDMYYYGPFSQELAEDMDRLEILGLVERREEKDGPADYRPGQRADEAISCYAGALREYDTSIGRTIMAFGPMSARELELHATVHYVRGSGGRERSLDQTVEAVRVVKGSRFSPEEIRSAFEYLRRVGF